MAKLKAVELDNGQWVYIQIDEAVTFADVPATNQPITRGGDFERKGSISQQAHKAVDKLSDVIRAMSETAAQALQESAFSNVNKITLEFGVKLAGEAGIPFITSGKAEGSVNVKVEFAPKKPA